MKKIVSILLSTILVFMFLTSIADEEKNEGALLDEYVEEMGETDSTFTVPVGIGIIYSVIIYRDGVGIVFSPIKSTKAAFGLTALDFITDVNNVKLYYKDGQSVVLPATVEIKSYDVGTFITLNLSARTMTSISELSAIESELDRISFIHSDSTETEMSVEELNQKLSDVFGGTVDIFNQVITALNTFWNNLTNGVGFLAADTYSSVEKALADAGDWISGYASSLSQALTDLSNNAGNTINEAIEDTGEFLDGAADTITSIWQGLWGK